MTSATTRCRRPTGRLLATLLLALVGLLVTAAGAGAEITYEYSFGSEGSGAGEMREPVGLAANNETGELYVADRRNNRVQVFTPGGAFVRAWGYDVVAGGPDDKPFADEVQRVAIKAIGGTFTLRFGASTTTPLAFDASASDVQGALNALPQISGAGSVTVAGGPGDSDGTNPYVVTFGGGGLAGNDMPPLVIDGTQLVRPVGTQLECDYMARYINGIEGSFDFQWLANGQPIAGATEPMYTPVAADSGKAIQCQVRGLHKYNPTNFFHSWDTNRDYTLVGSSPSSAPPRGPAFIEAPTGPTIPAGGEGGQTLTCNAGSWSNGPTSYVYEWFLRGNPLGPPSAPTAETTSQVTLTKGDAASTAAIQCRVTATNAGGSSTMWSGLAQTEPPIIVAGFDTPLTRVTDPHGVVPISTEANGGPVLEVCEPGDVCKEGAQGPGFGQFDRPRGIAVDNSPGGEGAVYVADDFNYRVQKFTAEGTPILEFGGEVNKTTGANLCTAASGDVCGPGFKTKSEKTGYFNGWPCYFDGCNKFFSWDELANTIAVDPNNGKVFVTDPLDWENLILEPSILHRMGRVQAFDSSGNFIGQARHPRDGLSEPHSIGMDREGRVLITNNGESRGVSLMDESEFTPEGTQRPYAERVQIHENKNARATAGDPTSDKIWVVDRNSSDFEFESTHVCGESQFETHHRGLVIYDHLGHELDCSVPEGPGRLTTASGIVISEDGRAFVTVRDQSLIRVFQGPVPEAPEAAGPSITGITSESATLHGQVNAGYEPTDLTFEFGTSPCSAGGCTKVTGSEKAYGLKFVAVEEGVEGLEPGKQYYYRLTATNPVGTDTTVERTFSTFPYIDLTTDPCPNALARKQTRTAGLFDCRAYELASADFTGGYDVISDLAPGAEPYEGFPEADDRVLYSVRDGGIPGTGNPTNRGPDPYVATRGAGGWTTTYVGIPADGTPSKIPFSSSLADADRGLGVFAFGGEICAPCFPDSSSGIPVHLPDGTLVQGMLGTNPHPDAVPAGFVADPLSADGTHLIFGSPSQFEPKGNANGDVTIYDRDLLAGTTQVVSTLDDESTMTGPGIGELAVSADGSRIVVGRQVGAADSAGNLRWHPYMHVGSSAKSVDLAPGATSGVLFAGMSADGTRAFYTTRDALVPGDTDSSVDVYEAEVGGTAPITPRLISVGAGGAGNDDGCTPAGSPDDWNSVAGPGGCDAVALAGGAGVAADGTAYFLSPELLDGGEAGQANLYVARPGASVPELVATIDSGDPIDDPMIAHAVMDSEVHRWGDFQTSADGAFALFASDQPLSAGYDNAGFRMVYRYDAAEDALDCVSCLSTEGPPSADALLPTHGLGLTEDGRAFFNSVDQLVMRDSNGKEDAYEWKGGDVGLISSGVSNAPSSLLTVTTDGQDAFFFTRDVLVGNDQNGQATKLYDARAGGGFFVLPKSPPCAASDECHGPGTEASPPPAIGTHEGSGGNAKPAGKVCKKGFVKKRGKCRKKPRHRKKRHGHARHGKGGRR